ncbi:MAG: biopolymer transporter ExbD [Cyclobacteriaceae bacterium]|nr:biopolymer transporter ExbD [Cyclobacteriaceae bacterium]
MARSSRRGKNEINAGSMADIAFLLLIFFLVTTTFPNDRGILFTLPPKPDPNQPPPDVTKNQRNIFKILVNSNDQLLVEDEPVRNVDAIKDQVKEFVLNNGRNPNMSDSPEEAVVSFKTDRGSSYEIFIDVLDQLDAAYNEMYGERVGMTGDKFRELRNTVKKSPEQRRLYDKARGKENGKVTFPKNISIAEPSNVGG